MNVLGLDLSLTSTGAALPDGTVRTLKSAHSGCERLRHLRDQVLQLTWMPVHAGPVDLVVVEGYAMGSKRQSHSYATGELGGVIRLMLHEARVPFVDVPPASLKKYATGKGNASKDEVLVAAVKRLGYDGACNDEADALWLRAMALDHLGEPAVKVPAAQRAAVDVIDWPLVDDRSVA